MTSADDQLGQSVEIEGYALSAAAGAMVRADDGASYYLDGVGSWPTDTTMKRVIVSGVLRLRPAQVEPRPPGEEHEHGLPDDTLVIDDPRWKLAD
jgi:hypothetical protein